MKIVLSVALVFFLFGCIEETQSHVKAASKSVSKQANEVSALVSKQTEEVVAKVQEASSEVVQKAKEVSAEVVKQAKESGSEAAAAVAQSTADMAQKAHDAIVSPSVPSLDGAALFKKCSGCHGAQGQNKAMGKSQVIKGWSVSKTSDALNGYKKGTYGGAMKAIMKGQASKLSDAEISAISEFISKQ